MKIFVVLLAVSMATVMAGHGKHGHSNSRHGHSPSRYGFGSYWSLWRQLMNLKADLLEQQKKINVLCEAAFSTTEYGGHTYYLSEHESLNNLNGEDVCEAMGGYLAEINDEAEYLHLQSFVGPRMSRRTHILIGGTDAAVEGTWVFDRTNTPVTYLDWAPGQPDNHGTGEHCLAFIPRDASSARMNDIFCNWGGTGFTGRLGYLCEVEG